MLAAYALRPTPVIINVDERSRSLPKNLLPAILRLYLATADAQVLTPILHRLCSTKTLPVLLVGGSPLTSVEQIRRLHESGELKTLVKASGATVEGHKKLKHGHRR